MNIIDDRKWPNHSNTIPSKGAHIKGSEKLSWCVQLLCLYGWLCITVAATAVVYGKAVPVQGLLTWCHRVCWYFGGSTVRQGLYISLCWCINTWVPWVLEFGWVRSLVESGVWLVGAHPFWNNIFALIIKTIFRTLKNLFLLYLRILRLFLFQKSFCESGCGSFHIHKSVYNMLHQCGPIFLSIPPTTQSSRSPIGTGERFSGDYL